MRHSIDAIENNRIGIIEGKSNLTSKGKKFLESLTEKPALKNVSKSNIFRHELGEGRVAKRVMAILLHPRFAALANDHVLVSDPWRGWRTSRFTRSGESKTFDISSSQFQNRDNSLFIDFDTCSILWKRDFTFDLGVNRINSDLVFEIEMKNWEMKDIVFWSKLKFIYQNREKKKEIVESNFEKQIVQHVTQPRFNYAPRSNFNSA